MARVHHTVPALVAMAARSIRSQRQRLDRVTIGHQVRVRSAIASATLREWWQAPAPTPLPPPRLRYRVHGSADADAFVHVGRVCAADVRRELALAGGDLDACARVLDFGCGCGRVAVHLFEQPTPGRLAATDVDAAAIAWCRRHLARVAEWRVNRPLPPTDYADATFDCIYGISVFTHLDGPGQQAWLRELKRIARPGALILLSLHGAHYEDSATPFARTLLRSQGIAWEPSQAPLQSGRPGSLNAFFTRAYVLREWSQLFSVVRYAERALNASQDVVVLRNG